MRKIWELQPSIIVGGTKELYAVSVELFFDEMKKLKGACRPKGTNLNDV